MTTRITYICAATADDPLARAVHAALKHAGLNPWYQEIDLIPGEPWDVAIPRAIVGAAQVLVLLTQRWPPLGQDPEHYPSEQIALALAMAKDTGTPVVPVRFDDVAEARVPYGLRRLAAIKCPSSPLDALVRRLTGAPAPGAPPRPAPTSPPPTQEPTMRADLAIITILPEEYQAAIDTLDDGAYVSPTAGQTNPHNWYTGTLPRANGAPLQVVVGRSGEAGHVAAYACTHDTATTFSPRHIVLLGVAGALPGRGPGLGDVVISEAVWDYEYGKVADGYRPRQNRTFRVDSTLLKSAAVVGIIAPDWADGITARRPRAPKTKPTVTTGPIASGNKVVDNATDPFFARVLELWPKLVAVEMEGAGVADAAQRLSEAGRATGLLMVRGISDVVPKRATDAQGAAAPDAGKEEGGTAVRDDWKPYASASAAAFLAAWVKRTWPASPAPAAAASAAHTAPYAPGTQPHAPAQAALAGDAPTSDIWATIPALRRRLAALFAQQPEVAMLLRDAGFNLARIDLTGSPEIRWYRALEEIQRFPDGIVRLRRAVGERGYAL